MICVVTAASLGHRGRRRRRPRVAACVTVPFERAVITKERLSRSYRLSAYFLAKCFTEMGIFAVLPFISVTICYLMAGLTYKCAPFAPR